MKLESLAGVSFNYEPVGATRTDETPAGFHRLWYRAQLGPGRNVYERAGEALMSWRMHTGAGLRIHTSTPRAEAGADSLGRLGIVSVPCRVVWTVEEPDQVGFGYGTLAGHPGAGEEAFLVTYADDDTVWFTLSAYSKPAAWYARLGGPLTRLAQRAFARRYIGTLRRLANTPSGADS
jgi:uncharacterized protein (UPF0548 family)